MLKRLAATKAESREKIYQAPIELPATIIIILFLLLPLASSAETLVPDFLKDINRRNYPFAHAVLAREIEHIEFHADGSKESQDDVYITVLDEDGKRENKVLSFSVNKAYGKLEIELCEIIRGGKISPINIAAQSREEADAGNSRSNIYNPMQKDIKLFLPGLEIGDTIHYRINRRQFKPIIENQIYGSILGQYDIPIRSYLFTVTTPVTAKLYWVIKDKIPGTVTYCETQLPGTNPKIIRSWHFTGVPQITPEPSMPSFRRVAMRLLYSTLPNWQAVATWYDRLVSRKLVPGDALKNKVNQLIADRPDRTAKLNALFYYVAQKIRYLGVSGESERPGFEPHDVNVTFSRRHGVCRDKAALLVSMLQFAGFNAKAVLIRVGDKLDYEIPLPYFNHAIVAVLDDNGNLSEFLDPTSETSRQFLPDYERECSYLIADRKKSDLKLTPPVSPEKNSFIMTIVDKLRPDGNLSGSIKVQCRGFSDTMMRSIMMNQSRKEQKLFLKRFFLSQYSTLEINHIEYSDPADRSRNFQFSGDFSLSLPSPEKAPPVAKLQPLSFMAYPSIMERWILARADMTKRHYPLKFGYTFTTVVKENLSFTKMPKKLLLPAPRQFENEIFSTSLNARQPDAKHLLVERRFSLKKTEVEAERYPLVTELQNRKQKLSLTPITVEW